MCAFAAQVLGLHHDDRSKTLYLGVTSVLQRRVWQHKNHIFPGFTAKYNLDRLVYLEEYSDNRTARAREKQLKGWTRLKKMALIVSKDPTWRDLSEKWGKPISLPVK
jgi:putative endonuclease